MAAGAGAGAGGAGAGAIWRTWLAGSPPSRVYLVHGPPIELGDRVIAFADPGELGPAERCALAFSALLWTGSPAPVIRFAGPSGDARLEGPDRDRVLAYLTAAPRLVASARPAGAAPADLRTDGEWVWSDEARHDLDRHHLAPDPALVRHIASAGYALPEVGPAALHRALAGPRPDARPATPSTPDRRDEGG